MPCGSRLYVPRDEDFTYNQRRDEKCPAMQLPSNGQGYEVPGSRSRSCTFKLGYTDMGYVVCFVGALAMGSGDNSCPSLMTQLSLDACHTLIGYSNGAHDVV
ncbi:hypothetical protein ACFE04_010250 [Oxalis oulophora]